VTRRKDRPATATVRSRASRATAADVAEILQVGREQVRRWTLDGCPRLDSGEYVIAEVVTWLRKRDVESAIAKLRTDTRPKGEMNRKLAVEADLKELQLAQLRANLVTLEVHRDVVERVAGGFAAVAKGQLARFKRRYVQCTTPGEAEVINQDIERALMEGAQGLAEELEAEAALEDVKTEDAA
jgi:phage terminase Nu1 subunit (DNA packaging protein)